MPACPLWMCTLCVRLFFCCCVSDTNPCDIDAGPRRVCTSVWCSVRLVLPTVVVLAGATGGICYSVCSTHEQTLIAAWRYCATISRISFSIGVFLKTLHPQPPMYATVSFRLVQPLRVLVDTVMLMIYVIVQGEGVSTREACCSAHARAHVPPD